MHWCGPTTTPPTHSFVFARDEAVFPGIGRALDSVLAIVVAGALWLRNAAWLGESCQSSGRRIGGHRRRIVSAVVFCPTVCRYGVDMYVCGVVQWVAG